MAQQGRSKQSSFPGSLFEIDEFDKHWDGDPPSGLELAREPSVPPEPESEVQASSARFEVDLPLILPDGEQAPTAPPRPAAATPRRRPSSATPLRDQADSEESERTTMPGDPLLVEVRDLYAMGDYSGALVIAEGILASDPDHVQARRYADNCRQVLEQMYCAKLGPLSQRPEVAVAGDQLRWLTLDHRAGFLLSMIDGRSSVEELLDISGMPRFEALRTLCDLLEQNVITLAR